MSGVDLLPAWPTSGDSEAAFNTKADALGPALSTMITQINTALGVTNISAWVSGAAYTAGTSVVWSLIDFYPYRRKTTSSAGTTDPSSDTINWAPATGPARKRLQANLTLYVATTGSDSNDGLTAGTPLLTIQKAWATLQADYDLNGFSATIQVADGTYTAGLNALGPIVGQVSGSSVVLNGNAGSPANVLINTGASACVQASAGGGVTVKNLKLQSTANALLANAGGIITGGNGLIFGTVSAGFAHIFASGNGVVNMVSSYTISAGAGYHFYASLGGVITLASGLTVTLSGAPAFSSCFAIAQDASRIYPVGVTFSGAATGTRYSVISNGVINTNGAGASFLPGSVAGSTATGGQYV